ncbi:nucleotidyltransferase family protein [uncultured Algibacter sp.]|uniref:nucleotidyltransferase family protein n=1 Tax=uncultured Algibacter sp. TaxID=298659 RepID=UPI002639D261|nr:nucleotidyltransferase family protein [uncultured Algibacter sp.]
MNQNKPNISIVILAAGASSRMGSPKQLLKWGNDSLLNHTIKTALRVDVSEIIVVLGANCKLIETDIKQHPVTILKNENWKLGLGKSIAFATEYVINSNSKSQGILVTLADQPLINSDYLNEMIQDFSPDESQIIATAYTDEKKGVPVLFDAVYFEELTKLSNDEGAKALLKAYDSFVKTLIPPVKNVDLDSKEDYETLHKANFKTK